MSAPKWLLFVILPAVIGAAAQTLDGGVLGSHLWMGVGSYVAASLLTMMVID